MRKEKHNLCFHLAIVQKTLALEDNITCLGSLYRTTLLIITPSAGGTQNEEGTKKIYGVFLGKQLKSLTWYFILPPVTCGVQ